MYTTNSHKWVVKKEIQDESLYGAAKKAALYKVHPPNETKIEQVIMAR
jgi:hypothetical protein